VQAVILCGIQASGKTTFYRERFFDTHVRISLDLLRTRSREDAFLTACFQTRQPFVVDNTNAARKAREPYITRARAAKYQVVGYFFSTEPKAALDRNRRRPGKAAIPAAGVFATYKRLEPPAVDEGFDELYKVEIAEPSGFTVTPVLPTR
jgi:predicted kinase